MNRPFESLTIVLGIAFYVRIMPDGLYELQASRLVSNEVHTSSHATLSDVIAHAGQFLLAAETADIQAHNRLESLARA